MVSDVSKTQSAKINTRPSMEMILLSFIVIFLRVLALAINLVYSILQCRESYNFYDIETNFE